MYYKKKTVILDERIFMCFVNDNFQFIFIKKKKNITQLPRTNATAKKFVNLFETKGKIVCTEFNQSEHSNQFFKIIFGLIQKSF